MQRPFRFGVVAAHATSNAAWIATAQRAEALGYATLLMPDRTSTGTLAPFPALAVAAQATTRLRLGTYVTCNGYHHPVVLARESATLDILSGGRFELGLGAGVSPAEFQRMGIPAGSPGARVEQLTEALQLLKRLFTEETVTFAGEHYTVTDLKGNLRPIQQPYPPLLVAGAGPRLLKVAAREANSIVIASRVSAQSADPADPPLEQKISWIKEAAGDRFSDLELGQTIFDLEISDSEAALGPEAGWPPVPRRSLRVDQAIAHLTEQQDRFGFSYLQVSAGQMENFAPVVARLSGN